MTNFGTSLVLTAGILYIGILAAVLYSRTQDDWPLWKVVLCRGLSGVLMAIVMLLFVRYMIPSF